uniref:Uncharacterized protein n=1 Tax=Ascaris lumbricoides TaxID=6252 RepID=A0A0M3I7H1_ASCLU
MFQQINFDKCIKRAKKEAILPVISCSNLYKKRTGLQNEINRFQDILRGSKRKDNEGEIVEESSRLGNKNCFFSLVQCSFYYR